MAEVASPSAPIDAKKDLVKPEKPDEEAYKAALKKAEKEHADSMTKFVSYPIFKLYPRLHFRPQNCIGFN